MLGYKKYDNVVYDKHDSNAINSMTIIEQTFAVVHDSPLYVLNRLLPNHFIREYKGYSIRKLYNKYPNCADDKSLLNVNDYTIPSIYGMAIIGNISDFFNLIHPENDTFTAAKIIIKDARISDEAFLNNDVSKCLNFDVILDDILLEIFATARKMEITEGRDSQCILKYNQLKEIYAELAATKIIQTKPSGIFLA